MGPLFLEQTCLDLYILPINFTSTIRLVLKWNKSKNCGLDLSKAVIITDEIKYIEKSSPQIRQEEFNALKGKDYFVKQKMETYIKLYIKALSMQHISSYKTLCKYSTLQYFHKELGIY